MQRRQGTLTVVGQGSSPRLQRILEFAERNRIPYRWLDPSDSAQKAEIEKSAAKGSGMQVIVRGRQVLQDPTVAEVARALGLELAAQSDVADSICIT